MDDKNHNPRKGTETFAILLFLSRHIYNQDKNHNPRKGTETTSPFIGPVRFRFVDKNHNPRKGTETPS